MKKLSAVELYNQLRLCFSRARRIGENGNRTCNESALTSTQGGDGDEILLGFWWQSAWMKSFNTVSSPET